MIQPEDESHPIPRVDWTEYLNRSKGTLRRLDRPTLTNTLLDDPEGQPHFEKHWDLSFVGVMRRVYDASPARLQVKLRSAATHAVTQWDRPVHGDEVLKTIVNLVANTEAKRAIPAMVEIVDREIVKTPLEAVDINLAGEVVSVVGGFIPERPAVDAYRRWYFTQKFPWQMEGLLATGLSEADADAYPKYMTRFFEVARKHPGYFNEEIVVVGLIEDVGIEKIKTNIHQLSPEDRAKILEILEQK